MGLADYQKQKEIKAAAEAGAKASRDGADVMAKLLAEAKETNRLLAALVAKG